MMDTNDSAARGCSDACRVFVRQALEHESIGGFVVFLARDAFPGGLQPQSPNSG